MEPCDLPLAQPGNWTIVCCLKTHYTPPGVHFESCKLSCERCFSKQPKFAILKFLTHNNTILSVMIILIEATGQSCQSLAKSFGSISEQYFQHISCPQQVWSANAGQNTGKSIQCVHIQVSILLCCCNMVAGLGDHPCTHGVCKQVDKLNAVVDCKDCVFALFLSPYNCGGGPSRRTKPPWIELLHDQLLPLFECSPGIFDAAQGWDQPSAFLFAKMYTLIPTSLSSQPLLSPPHMRTRAIEDFHGRKNVPKLGLFSLSP